MITTDIHVDLMVAVLTHQSLGKPRIDRNVVRNVVFWHEMVSSPTSALPKSYFGRPAASGPSSFA